jgi:glycosyltransferase involved in cell wall biosynthesis
VTTQPTKHPRARVFYVSYDGIAEPLGRSQVLAYLYRLADDYEITLFSFEKPGADKAALRAELSGRGIEWRPLGYHRRPPVLSTLLDVAVGVNALRAAARLTPPDLVHVRSYVPALIAMWARRFTRAPLLFDIRGFWADERVEGGIWPSDRLLYRLLYRLAKRCERWFFTEADAIVTLTHASAPQVKEWAGDRDVPIVVIPTCAELERFGASVPRTDGPHLTWCGSIGTWYRFDLAPRIGAVLGWELDVVTRQQELARAVLGPVRGSVRELSPAQVPSAMFAGDVGLCLYVASFSRLACAPTRFAEHLAAGMPVVVTADVGDMEAIVTEYQVGVVLRGEDQLALNAAADQIQVLQADSHTSERCRRVARELFDVDVGAARYASLYESVLNGAGTAAGERSRDDGGAQSAMT